MPRPDADNPADPPADDATVAEDLSGVRIGDYVIRGRLGRGGMGTVYRAEDAALGREVAVKVIRPELARGAALERFMREARAMASLSHPNLLAIHAIGRAEPLGDLPYFVMELIRGRSLAEILRQKGPPPIAETLCIAGQILAALDAVHAAGITHRDLKPANIMIRDDDRRPVLMDFGIAKVDPKDDESGLTTEGLVIGTPEYMAPEQAEAGAVDARTDLYAFGILLYQMISGRVPFHGKSAFRVLRQQVESEPQALRELVPDCPEPIAAACFKCMRKDPAERYQNARQLADALKRAETDAGSGERPEFQPPAPDSPPGELPSTAPTLAEGVRDRRPPTESTLPIKGSRLSGPAGWIAGIAAAAALVTLVLWLALPGKPPRWTRQEIDAKPYTRLKLPGGATRTVKLLAIEPAEDGGFELTYWYEGRIRRVKLKSGFEWDNRSESRNQ